MSNGPRVLLALTPAALVVYLGFRAGGFYIGSTAGVAMVLLLLLAARVILVPLPGEGLNRSVAIAVAGLALYAVWNLISSGWSDAPARALIEFDRVLLYASALALFGLVGMDSQRLRWMVGGIALATLIVCGAGLITRLLPDVWPLVEGVRSTRLSHPVGYWNALGLLAALGIILCFGLMTSERESRIARVVGAAAIPVLASALLLTLSRGAVATAVLGILLVALIGHPRALLTGLLAVAPATAIALSTTYRADLLVSDNPLTSAAQAQGHDVAVVVALCAVGAGMLRALLLYVDDFLSELRPSAAVRRLVLGAGAITLAVAVVATGGAIDAPGHYEAFVSSGEAGARPASEPLHERSRLTTITDNGRIVHWTVAVDEFKRNPLKGTGAGTYEHSWDKHRPPIPSDVLDAHGLYVEVLGELGLVGLALLLIALVTIVVGVARRARGPDRALFATILAAIVAWAVAAGFDWHWEMPVVTIWVFALGGAAIAARRRTSPPTRFLGVLPRSLIAIACCALVALVPVRLIISQDKLESALIAYGDQRCDEVSMLAQQSLNAVSSRPEPRELSAACELSQGRPKEAIKALRAAVERDPDNWRLRYSLAVAQARDGQDPRPEIRRARRLNPRNPLIQQIEKGFEGTDSSSEWRKTVRDLRLSALLPTI